MPELSVVIPTYGRPSPLRRCLAALADQTAPHPSWEVIVVDDGSPVYASSVLASFDPPYRLTVLRQPNAGAGAARNRGVQAARGWCCLFLDDDTVPDRELVAAHLAAQQRFGGVVGIGRIGTTVDVRADWFARASALRRNRHYARLDARRKPLQWTDCYSGNLSVPRDAFLAAGGFAVDLTRAEDVDLGFRLARAGLLLVYVREACTSIVESKRLPDLARDLERTGEMAVVLARRCPAMEPSLLGSFGGSGGPRQRRLLRGVLALGLPARVGAVIARLLWWGARSPRRAVFLYQLCFWRGVRHALGGDHDAWRRLTAQPAVRP